jgi:hypothetical protein
VAGFAFAFENLGIAGYELLNGWTRAGDTETGAPEPERLEHQVVTPSTQSR